MHRLNSEIFIAGFAPVLDTVAEEASVIRALIRG